MVSSYYRTLLYAFAQALAISCAVISVSVAAIVGKKLAPDASLSTLPYGLQFVGLFCSSYVISMAMKRYGRKRIFLGGCIILFSSGILGAYSIFQASFLMNIFSHVFLGIALACFAYFRFAATDGLADYLKARAVSLVVLGGVLAAFAGPYISHSTRGIISEQLFAGCYLSFSVIAIMLFCLLQLIPRDRQISEAIKKPDEFNDITAAGAQLPILRLSVAIYASGFGYMLMGMIMMQSSLKLHVMDVEFTAISFVIQCHVLAMFLPSLFMGKLINRFGAYNILLIGYATMMVSMMIAIFFTGYNSILIALIGIGLGWNMLYVGGSSLVSLLPGDSIRMQGINETAVGFLSAVGALSAGVLFSFIGWQASNWLAMILLVPGVMLLIISRMKNKRKHQEKSFVDA